jgi:putative ABC transport system substrate-binding protein
MMQRRVFVAGMAAVIAIPRAAQTQQSGRLATLGVLGFGPPGCSQRAAPGIALSERLQELGWKEGLNLRMERRCTTGENEETRRFATELVNVNPDVIVVWSSLLLMPVAAVAKSTPVVFIDVADPVGSGFVRSLSRPAGNLTGVSDISLQLTGKRLDLLRELIPRLARVGILSNPRNPTYAAALGQAKDAVAAIGLRSYLFEAANVEALDAAFAAMTKQRIDGLLVQPDSMFCSSATESPRSHWVTAFQRFLRGAISCLPVAFLPTAEA